MPSACFIGVWPGLATLRSKCAKCALPRALGACIQIVSVQRTVFAAKPRKMRAYTEIDYGVLRRVSLNVHLEERASARG